MYPESLNPPQPDASSVSAAGALPSSAVCAVPRGALCHGLGFEAMKVLGCGAQEKEADRHPTLCSLACHITPLNLEPEIPNIAQFQNPNQPLKP